VGTSTSSEYVPQDDESEAMRLAQMRGTGEAIFVDPEEMKHYTLDEFSLGGALGDLNDIPERS
jgi:hypothetical protein